MSYRKILAAKHRRTITAAGLIGNLIGATAAGLLYGYSTGLPFLIEGLICIVASLVLLLPGIARMFLAVRRNAQGGRVEVELIEERIHT